MEFKGTKGKWIVESTNKKGAWIGNENGYSELSCGNTNEEATYNAQLIAHAPEMLDFINRISGEMLRNDFVLDEKWYEQAKQIIIRATTI